MSARDTQPQPPLVDRFWQAVLNRDREWNGRFVYAVRSTGVYCKPSCPARRPDRSQVLFFEEPAAAEREGFRACLRCRPQEPEASTIETRAINELCRRLKPPCNSKAIIDAVAARTGLGPRRLRNAFRSTVGVTPTQYARGCRRQHVRVLLHGGKDVTRALYEAGYGSPSRLYESAAETIGMTPAIYGRGGAGTTIRYTVAACPLGSLLVAATDKGICSVRLGDSQETLEAELRTELPAADIRRDHASLHSYVAAILRHLDGQQPSLDLPLDVRSTAFQLRVWQELRKIPRGRTRTYGEVAAAIGSPKSVRAVARACASNPVALIVPCHRVIGEKGQLTGYRWGLQRKKDLLAREKSDAEQP